MKLETRNLKLETPLKRSKLEIYPAGRDWRVTPNAQGFGAANVNNETSSEHPVFCRGGSVCGTTSFPGRRAALWAGKFPVSSFQSSFTLIELVVTIAISGIVILAIISQFQEAAKGLAQPKAARSATVLSEDMMNEIRSKYFTDPQTNAPWGPDPGETNRLQFDDVDDYHGWTGSPPETIEGAAMTNYDEFKRSVTVGFVSPTNLDQIVTNVTSLKRIEVVVSCAEVVISNVSVMSVYD